MEQTYRLGRKRISAAKAGRATSAEARLAHLGAANRDARIRLDAAAAGRC